MDDPSKLPFKVGDVIETKSFMTGYRGAWFECKIKEIGSMRMKGRYLLEYVTYPDEKPTWTHLYQRTAKLKDAPKHLMLRPSFPRVYNEKQMPDLSSISDLEIVIFNDVLKVGDFVDWCFAGCMWSGKITEVLSDGKFKIELPTPPDGEGSSYEVLHKDLRPSLDWSLVDGWTVPKSKESENPNPCARLINLDNGSKSHFVKPLDQVIPDKMSDKVPRTSAVIEEDEDHQSWKKMKVDGTGCHGSLEKMKDVETDDLTYSKAEETVSLNPMPFDSIEAAVVDLEELICKVRWIRGILEYGTPSSEKKRSSWKFVEHRE